MNPIERIEHKGELLALIVSREFSQSGIRFFTENEMTQQLAYMQHPVGKVILPHVHNAVERTVFFTQEVLVLRKGKMRVDFYSDDQLYLESRMLQAGDVILLAKGGHGFEVIEEVEMFEVKQGPYAGDKDKVRFAPVAASELKT